MKAAYCPICDQKMKKKHYCSNCKSFVARPVMMEDYTKKYSETFSAEHKTSHKTTHKTGSGKRSLPAGVAIIIFSVFSFLASFIGEMDFSDGDGDEYTEAYNEAIYTEEETILSKNTVIKDYDECNGLSHMDINIDEFIPVLDEYMEGELSRTYIDEYDDLRQVRTTYEDGRTEDTNYFHNYIDTYYSSDDSYLGYYIDYDISSYRMHMFDISSNDKELLTGMIQLFIDATGEELLSADENLEDFYVYNGEEDYTNLYRDEYWLYFSVDEYEEGLSYYFSVELY